MRKTTVKGKPALKEPAPKESLARRFSVTLEVEGAMLDKDTPIGEQSLVDFFQMQFACPKGLKLLRAEAREIK